MTKGVIYYIQSIYRMIQKNILILFSIFLIFIFQWITSIEKFTGITTYDTVTVSLPLTTTYSCANMCGPTARCSITGQQCTADIDCPGCQPQSSFQSFKNNCIPGENDAGKLTSGATPTYSSLTTDIGTRAKLFASKLSKPAQANFGVNTWRSSFDEERKMFDNRYKCNNYPFLMNYPTRYSATGEFLEKEPLASNAYL